MFDPFNIYKRQIRSSHVGQVLRKKIRRKSGKVYTNEELESVIPVLRGLGYNVIKGNLYETQITSWSDTYMIDTGSVVFPNTNPNPFLFSTIWPDIKTDFAACLAIDPVSVVNILFEIDLISINLYGSYQTSGSSVFPNINVYMADPTLPITVIPLTVSMPNPSTNFHICFRAFSDSQYFITESANTTIPSAWGTSSLLNKTESTDNNFLNVIERRQPAIITALRNDDYSVFNPALFYMYISQAQQVPATISNSFIEFQVKMIVEHK